jgi:SAM-dependent methyltransferase
MWGGPTTAEFYSGEGTEEAASQPYVDRIRGLITEHGIKTVLDIGCGDFRVGEKILHGTNIQGYIGVDVVPDLVRYNERRFRAVAGVQFLCLDAVKDELPAADLCLLRLVLQHLSNHQVQILLSKVARYPLVIATDEISDASPGDYNRDKSPGPHVRLGKGLALEHSPFGAKIEKLFEQPLGRKAVMRTVRIITRAVA